MTAPNPQPKFAVVKKAQVSPKWLSAHFKKLQANKDTTARVYELLEHASGVAEGLRSEFTDEIARLFGFPSRHEFRAYVAENKLGFECDDETGEARLFETIPPAASETTELPAVTVTPKAGERFCRNCGFEIEFCQAAQHFIHKPTGKHECVGIEEGHVAQPKIEQLPVKQ